MENMDPAHSGSSSPLVNSTSFASAPPAGFWIRFVATLIDGILVGLVTWPINYGIASLTGMKSAFFGNPDPASGGAMMSYYMLSWSVTIVLSFVYYGWFYKNKGATPGKLAVGIKVVDAETGEFIGYFQTFGREVPGKMISGVILMIGFIMAGLRPDKRALHDLIFRTRVVKG